MQLAVSILFLVFLTNVLAWIGHTVLLDAAYAIYQRVFISAQYTEQKELKTSIVELKKELGQTSAQEEFAKWAKLRRKVDKGLSDLEKLNARLSGSKATFSSRLNWLLWAATTGAQFVLVWWYRRQPVFYLPPGWLGPFAWFFSLPSAPSGSVSCAAWQMACQRVLSLGEGFVKGFLEPTSKTGAPPQSAPVAAKEKES